MRRDAYLHSLQEGACCGASPHLGASPSPAPSLGAPRPAQLQAAPAQTPLLKADGKRTIPDPPAARSSPLPASSPGPTEPLPTPCHPCIITRRLGRGDGRAARTQHRSLLLCSTRPRTSQHPNAPLPSGSFTPSNQHSGSRPRGLRGGGCLPHPGLQLGPLLGPTETEKGFGKAGWLPQPAPCPGLGRLTVQNGQNTHTLFTALFFT